MTVAPAPVRIPTGPLRRGLAFAAGASFAFVPALGPFLALLVMVSARVELQRADRWWWAAAVLLGVPWLVGGSAGAGALAVAQVLAIWLIYRSASAIRGAVGASGVWRDASLGLVLGLTGTLLRGLMQMEYLDLAVQRSFAQAIIWAEHPNLFAHTILAASLLAAILMADARLRLLALTLGAVGILATGAREAAVAWVVVVLVLIVRTPARGLTRAASYTMFALVLVVAAGVGPALGLGRTGFLVDLVGADGRTNLLRGTEVARGDWWYPLGVAFTHREAAVAGVDLVTYAVTKLDDAPWSRLQQVVSLSPDTYTLSVLLRPGEEAAAGIDGWGRSGTGSTAREFHLATTLGVDGTWRTSTAGPIRILEHRSVDAGDGWIRVSLTFVYTGETAPWYVGVVPDRSDVRGRSSTFAALQLERGDDASAYRPAPADRGLDLAAGRIPVWRDAVAAIVARPLVGWGPKGFQESAHAGGGASDALNRPLAAHAHSSYLDVAVERGVIGLVGLLLLVAMLALRAVQHRDLPALVVLTALLCVAVFDTTLLAGGVIYPLAAVLGWRASIVGPAAEAETGPGSGLAVRLTLAATDWAGAVTALAVAGAVATAVGHPPSEASWALVPYLALVWPAMALREGNYPGYGRHPAEELRSSVAAAAYASLVVAFGTVVLRDAMPLAPVATLVMTVVSMTILPLGRALAKRALLAFRVWGRPVAVLGTGPQATALVEHLERTPLLGLRPSGRFGEERPGDARILGPVEAVWPHLEAKGIRHLLLAAGEFPPETVQEVLERSQRTVRSLHVLPDLRGLPATAVAAVPLGQTLTLQVRNELASTTNRVVKRAIDVVAACLALAVLSPVVAALWAWVRLDSPGPGFYRSLRIGRDGRAFHCVKFRTMHLDAERRLEELLATDSALEREYRSFHKLRSDPRVTTAGRTLRAWSLDELPQLFNVLQGTMSLIGPRPYLLGEGELLRAAGGVILSARPGLTGYWQVYGRNDVTFGQRLEMETYYVRNWSLWWDLVILFETPLAVLKRRGR